MARPGPTNSIADVAGVKVGCAEDRAALTGVTVIVPEKPATCAVDVRGGGPGTRETDALAPENLVDAVDAIVLSGGSVYGLGAADGVAAAIGAEGKGFALVERPGVPRAPMAPAAILYDLANGGDKKWGEAPPYAALGKAAYKARGAHVPLGNAGAGLGALAGKYKGGQGSASIVTHDGFIVAALVAVNSFGSVTIPNSRAFWAYPYECGGEFGSVAAPQGAIDLEDWGASKIGATERVNTTIACIAVDAALTPSECKRIAQMASAGFARAIRPVFAPTDGDVVFALATGARELGPYRPLDITRLGSLAADCLARAIARGVYEATSIGIHKAWRDFD